MTITAEPGQTAPPIIAPVAMVNPGLIWPLGLSALAWVLLGLLNGAGIPLALCVSVGGFASEFQTALRAEMFYLAPWRLAIEWSLMVAAMMFPLAAPHLSVISAQSYPDQRKRLTLTALASYAAIWALIGPVFVMVMVVMRAGLSAFSAPGIAPVLAFGIAALWCFFGWRQMALRRCHAVPALYGRTWRTQRSAALYGARLGLLCAVVCAPAMAAPMLAGQGIIPMLLITHVLLAERLHLRPRRSFTAISIILIGLIAFLPSI